MESQIEKPRRGLLRRAIVHAVTLIVGVGLAVVGLVAPSSATGTNTGGDCTYEWVREIPQSHSEYKYKKTIPAVAGVKEYKYKKEVKTYKTQHWAKYQKHVKGRVEKKWSGSWRDTGTDFDWTKWEGDFWNTNGSFKVRDWADTASPDVIEEGGHSSVSDTYVQNGYTYRWVSERYSYRVIERQTRQVQTGSTWEYSDWTTETRGAPWIKVEERWKVEPVPEQTVWYNNGNWTTDTPGSPWVKVEERTVQDPPIKQGPVRSATEPDRGQYPDVPWTKVPGSEVCPGGQSSFSVDCESITLNAPTGVTPTGSESRYLIDGVVKPVGTHPVSAGDHTITLEVKVNGAWKKVDEDKVKVEVCPSGGTSKFETSCNTLKLYAPTGVVPEGAELRYLLDGAVKAPGTYTLPAGSYQLVLEAKVNGTWRQVDKDTVTIEDCKPMPAASGTVDCSGFVVNLDNSKGEAPASFPITKPDGTTEIVTVPAGQTASRTYPVIEDQTATVTVKSEGMKDFTLSFAADCKPNEVQPPTVPVVDECGPGNAHFGAVPSGPWTWVINPNGSMTITANPGNTFPNGPSVTIPAPVDSNVPCPVPPVPPTPQCPLGSPQTDLNHNGVIEPPQECVEVIPPVQLTVVKGGAQKVDKCGTAGDMFAVKKHKGLIYKVKGKNVREGVWLSTKGAKKVVVTVKPASSDYVLKKGSKTRWVFKFSTKPCKQKPDKPVDTGAKTAAAKVLGRFNRSAA